MEDEIEPTEEELIAFFAASVTKMEAVDNGDGTTTMTFFTSIEEAPEFVTLFEVTLAELMGEAIKASMPIADAFSDRAVTIPNSPKEAE